MTNLTHDQIRAILLRIEPEYFRDFDTTDWDAFFEFAENLEGFERFAVLYAESQHALREISNKEGLCSVCGMLIAIARNARKGGSNGSIG